MRVWVINVDSVRVGQTSPEQDSPVDPPSSLDFISSPDLASLVQDTPEVIQEPPAPETPNLKNFNSPSETVRTDLKTKDLKAGAKEAARSLQEELGPISSALLQSDWFVEAAVRNLNIQLEDFSDEDRGRRPGRFFSRVFKMFRTRRSRVSPGPLRAYIRSAS
uniref:Uncharacterized protein n=1 Tax=Knipowitschia caucasica TaxID=637954 RepID=A0AAV2MK61_KNICA